MAAIAKGIATFTSGGAETQSVSWVDAILGTPVTFSVPPPIVWATMTVTDGTGAGVPYFNGGGAITTTGATVTVANPPGCTVTINAVGS
jgi:hypothetical protein